MPKNKDEDSATDDAFYTLERLINFHTSLSHTSSIVSPPPRAGVTTALDKLEEHINAILNSFDFTPDTEEA